MASEGTERKQLPITSTDPGDNSGPQDLSGESQGCRRKAEEEESEDWIAHRLFWLLIFFQDAASGFPPLPSLSSR